MLTLITTARLNDIDPKAWRTDVLARIAELPASRLHELLPWEWKAIKAMEIPATSETVSETALPTAADPRRSPFRKLTTRNRKNPAAYLGWILPKYLWAEIDV
ncbi:transposase domain-containing protein [Neorhizobium huautlense]|uniref:transposase domain-containing protein n=1 Tax=Neorhizobium huautlense TaxID=67774 RepID=UPI003CC96BF4